MMLDFLMQPMTSVTIQYIFLRFPIDQRAFDWCFTSVQEEGQVYYNIEIRMIIPGLIPEELCDIIRGFETNYITLHTESNTELFIACQKIQDQPTVIIEPRSDETSRIILRGQCTSQSFGQRGTSHSFNLVHNLQAAEKEGNSLPHPDVKPDSSFTPMMVHRSKS